MAASDRKTPLWLLGALALLALGAAVYGLRWLREPALPAGFASGNGRVEATQYDVATKRPGRLEEVRVDEGDMVEKGQVLARMDVAELEAARREAEATLQRAREGEHLATAVVAQRESERQLARAELARVQALAAQNVASQQRLDEAHTRSQSAEAAASAAQEQVHEARAAIAAAAASVARIQTELDDATLRSPIRGRVLYRLAEPGEVLGAGGKVVTLLELADVYMTIFLPTPEAGRVAIGAEARVALDAMPESVLPARVSFVSPEAQFTPKEVETRTEREQLMFRVKVQIDPAVLEQRLEQVKTGVPGVATVRLDPNAPWPPQLAPRLPE